MAYKQLVIWGGVKQFFAQDGERQSIHYGESESKKTDGILMAHILSETTRDESILTYADNGI